jgi:putative two-component system response regulator
VKRVLIVDDSVVILKQVKIQLARHYDVMLANSGEMALQVIRQKRPDLFLLDIEMPNMNGFELFKKLKMQPSLYGIPVIFHSSITDADIQQQCIKLGAKDYIIKPTYPDVLLYRIALHLQLSNYLEKMEETVSALSGIMTESFAELINFRYKMEGHSERVPKICALLGRELMKQNIFSTELTQTDLNLMVQASPLHDIGNITIPDKILLKQGPLEESERNIMKNHCTRGAAILNHFSRRCPNQRFFQYARQIALAHHEAWDGTGYPAGLKKNDIPVCGRLVAVADVYDNITSERVYRSRLNHEEAYKVIISEKGKRLDPQIIEAFEKVKDEIEIICL